MSQDLIVDCSKMEICFLYYIFAIFYSKMLKTVTQYSTFTFLGAAVILMLSFVVEKGIEQVDEMLVPCQHGTPFVQGKCRCEGTPFNGTYCSNCMCEHGVCSTDPTTPFSNSDYGCRCPTQSKRFGFLCDLCNTVDSENGTCKGECKPEFFGAKCERICYANLPYDNDNEVCKTMRASGGQCNACNGHGTCQDGFCECDTNWYDDGREECVQTCPGNPICNGHGTCKLYGNTPGCLCELGWNGPQCDIPCPGMLETGTPCNNNGICEVDFDSNTATCECLEKFRGEDCSIECPGDVVACNGHGTCDDLGVCTCQTNVKWSLPSCKCSDELTCNAKGTCDANEECDCFGNFGGKFCLECKRNWHGENCDLYCDPFLKANQSDRVAGQFGCFGHGTCLEHNEEMYCTCNLDTTSTRNIGGAVNNYVSYYEAEMNCGECQEEYFPKQWVVQTYGMPEEYTVPCEVSCTPATCNGRGVCNHDFGVPGESLCSCNHEHLDDQSFCTACEANWYPLNFDNPQFCHKYCAASGDLPEECDGTIDCVQCNGHGTCTEEGDCLCTDGYTGDQCQIYCTSDDGLTCGGHGTCESNEIQLLMEHEFRQEGGIPLFGCTCDPQDPVDADSRIDWDEKLALGLVNGTLDPPPTPEYYGETCTSYCEKPPWEDSDECNGMGNCTVISIITNGKTTPCHRDSDCTSNTEMMRQLTADNSWKDNKGPFCYRRDEIVGCEKTTNDCYEILLKHRPRKMRSEDCVKSDECLEALNQEDWKGYCELVAEKKQPHDFLHCKSVESFCPERNIPSYCKTMLGYTDGSDVSYKLDLAYEFDKRRYPSKITESYRSEIATLEHDEAYAEFENVPDFPVLPDTFCPDHAGRYPQIISVRENKQYLCNGVLVNDTNCSGTFEQTVSFYTPFLLVCPNSVTGYHDYIEALQNRDPGCTIVEQDKTHVFTDATGTDMIDATCEHINSQFPSCKYPLPCDFNPCSPDHTCENKNGLAICSTTGDLNSTCAKGVSTRLGYSSYSCAIEIPDTTCPKDITFNTNLASHCLNHNPIRSNIPSIQEGQSLPFTETKHIHFEFKAIELVGTSTVLEFSDAIAIYIRQGQLQLNEVEALQACPLEDQQCHMKFMYETDKWYHVELELNNTHVTMSYNGNTVTKAKLSQSAITSVRTVSANSVAQYRNIISEVDIPSPFHCEYETCNLDVSYRSICSDIIRNVPYPTLLEPKHDILHVCSNIHEKTRIPDSDYKTLEQMYALNWNVYCNFYNSLESSLVIPYTDLENYDKCREFIDPLDGQLECIQTALDYNWTDACLQLNHAKVPDNLKAACPSKCYNHLFDTGDFCDERSEIFETNTKVIDICDHDWYNYCLMDAKGSLQGVCSAAECVCDKEEYEGITGNSCELHCPMASDGSACAENSNMGMCDYTSNQKAFLESGKLFDPIWALEGECNCFLSEGTRACDIECSDCNNQTYGEINKDKPIEPVTYLISNLNNDYVIGNEINPSLSICVDTPITFVRNTSDHTLRVVKDSDCELCETGIYSVLPNSTLEGWIDVNGLENQTYTFGEVGTYYYVCTAHENMLGKITVQPCFIKTHAGQIGMCNNARGVCECLPPYTSIEYQSMIDWKGKTFTHIQRVFNVPDFAREDNYRLRMMQGAESFIKHALEFLRLDEEEFVVQLEIQDNEYVRNNVISPTISLCANYEYTYVFPTEDSVIVLGEDCENLGCAEGRWNQLPPVYKEFSEGNVNFVIPKNGIYYILSRGNPELVATILVGSCQGELAYTGEKDWEELYNEFLTSPEVFWCQNTVCSQADISELANLDGTTSRYNYDCNKVCPGTNETTKIPCNSRGYCTVVGTCVCEPARILKNTDTATVQKYQIIPNIEITEVSGGESSLENSGFRGDDCSIICPGFDPILSDMNTICNGHGICDVAGQCACDYGYTGDECQFKCPFSEGSVCTGHGTCEMGEIEITLQPFEAPSQTCLHYANIDACQSYSIINNMTFVDISGTKIVGENEACIKINKNRCSVWGDYQNINYTHVGDIQDETKPSGCIEMDRILYFNTINTDISCGIFGVNCICETEIPDVTYCTIDKFVVAHTKGGEEYTLKQGRYEGTSYNFRYKEMFQGQCLPDFYVYASDKTCSDTNKIDVGDNLIDVNLETCKIYCLSNRNCMYFDYDGKSCNMYTECTQQTSIGIKIYKELEEDVQFDDNENTGSVDEKVYRCYQACIDFLGFIINTGTGKCSCKNTTSDCIQVPNDYVRYDIGQVDYEHAKELCDNHPCMGLQEEPPGSDEWYAMKEVETIKTGSVVSFARREQCTNGHLLGFIPTSLSYEEQTKICSSMCSNENDCNFFTIGEIPYEFKNVNYQCDIEISKRECTMLANTELMQDLSIIYDNGCKVSLEARICRTSKLGTTPCYSHNFCDTKDLNRVQTGLNWNSKTLIDCKEYASTTNGFVWKDEILDISKPYGCIVDSTTNFVYFNTGKSITKCSETNSCLQYNNLKTIFVSKTSYTRDDCEAYMDENGFALGTSIVDDKHPGPGICEDARFVAHEDTTDACSLRCRNDPFCTAFSYNGSTCFLSNSCQIKPWNGYSYSLREYRKSTKCQVKITYNTIDVDVSDFRDKNLNIPCDDCETECTNNKNCKAFVCNLFCIIIERDFERIGITGITRVKDLNYMGQINSSDVSSGCIIDENRNVYENVNNNTVACGDVKNLTVTTHVPERTPHKEQGMCVDGEEAGEWRLIMSGQKLTTGTTSTVTDISECLNTCKGEYASLDGTTCVCSYKIVVTDDSSSNVYERMRPDTEEACSTMCEESPECVSSSFDMAEYRIKDTNVPLLMGNGYASGERDKTYNETLDSCRIRCQNDANCMGYSFQAAALDGAWDPACFLTSTQPTLPLTTNEYPWVTYSMGKRTLRNVHLENKEFTFTTYVTPKNEGTWSSYSTTVTQIFSGISTSTLTEAECEQYATDEGLTYYGAITQDYRPKGCIKINTNQIWFNRDSTSTIDCGTTSNAHVSCIVSGPCEKNNLKRDGYEYKYTTECQRRLRDGYGALLTRHTSSLSTGFNFLVNKCGHIIFNEYNANDYLSKSDYRSPCIRQRFQYEADGYCADERDKIQHHAVTQQECEQLCADDNDCVAFSFTEGSEPSCSLSSACLDVTPLSGSKTYRVDAKYTGTGKELTGNPLPKDATTKVTLKRGHAGRHLKAKNLKCASTPLYSSSDWDLMKPTDRHVGQKCDGGVQKLYGNGDNDPDPVHTTTPIQFERCYNMCSNYSSFSLKDNGECWCHEENAKDCTKISGIILVSSGTPDMSLSQAECEEYANSIGVIFETNAYSDFVGCALRTETGRVYYSTNSGSKPCSVEYNCIEEDWDVYQINGPYEDMYNIWVDRAFDYCMDHHPTTNFVSIWRYAFFRCFDTCDGTYSDQNARIYSKAGMPALHLYYNDTLECTATFSKMGDFPGQVSPDTMKFGIDLLGTMENTTLTMPKCTHSKTCNLKIGQPIDYEHHCYSTNSEDILLSQYTANVEQCAKYALDNGARYISFGMDSKWCMVTTTCEETGKFWNDDYVIYDLHQQTGTTTIKEPKEIKRFSGQDQHRGMVYHNNDTLVDYKQTYGGWAEFLFDKYGHRYKNKGDVMNNHFLGNGYCQDAYRVYSEKLTLKGCWERCDADSKCTAFSFGQYAQHLPTCALSTLCKEVSTEYTMSKAQCQKKAIKANEAFIVVHDSTKPSGCYFEGQYVWNTHENMNYFKDTIGDWEDGGYGDTHIIGDFYTSYTSVSNQEDCIDTCEENGFHYSSFATNDVGCRCSNEDTETHAYSAGLGIYTKHGVRRASMNKVKSWSVLPIQESMDVQLPKTTYEGEGKCIGEKIDSRSMTVATCAIQCGKDPTCNAFSYSAIGGHEFAGWGYPNSYQKMYDGRQVASNNIGTWEEIFNNCHEACATYKREKQTSRWHSYAIDSFMIQTNPSYKGACYCNYVGDLNPSTEFSDSPYTTNRIVPSCILSTDCSQRTDDTFGWKSYKVHRVKKRCKEGTVQINEKCYDKVGRLTKHYIDNSVRLQGDCQTIADQCTAEGGRLPYYTEYNNWANYMEKSGKATSLTDYGVTDYRHPTSGRMFRRNTGSVSYSYGCSERWFICVTEMEEVTDKNVYNQNVSGVLKDKYVVVHATKETCAAECAKPKYQYAFKGECDGVFTTHTLGIEACYDTCKAEGAKSMTIHAGQCMCKNAEVNTCMRINKGANHHTYTLNEYETIYASYGSECRCSNHSDTINTNAQVTTVGNGDFSMSEAECEAYAVAHTNLEYQQFEASTLTDSPSGCFVENRIMSNNYQTYYYYNRAETSVACATNGDLMGCIKTNRTDMHTFKVRETNWTKNEPMPTSTYYISRSGFTDLSMEECEAYSSMETGSWSDRPYGCIHSGGLTYWNTDDTGLTCASFPCVKRLEMDSYLMDVPEAGRSYSGLYSGTERYFKNSLIHSPWTWLDA